MGDINKLQHEADKIAKKLQHDVEREIKKAEKIQPRHEEYYSTRTKEVTKVSAHSETDEEIVDYEETTTYEK